MTNEKVPILLKIKRQDALAIFHLAEDSGAWFSVACAGGVNKALGRRLEPGEEIIVEVTLREIPNGHKNTDRKA